MAALGIHRSKSEVMWNTARRGIWEILKWRGTEQKTNACGPETGWLILRVKAPRFVETSVAIYQPTRRNITEGLNLLEVCHSWKNESDIMGLQDNLVVPVLRTGTIVHSQSVVPFVPDHFHTIGTSMLDPQPSWLIVHRQSSAVLHCSAWWPVVLFSLSAGSCSHSLLNFIFNLFKYESQYGPEIFLFSKSPDRFWGSSSLYSMGTGISFSGEKATAAQGWLPPSSAEVKSENARYKILFLKSAQWFSKYWTLQIYNLNIRL